MISEFNENKLKKTAVLIPVLLIFFLMLYCNYHTALIVDDFTYQYSFATGERISSLAEIFPSMASHSRTMNGRLVSHFLVQAMLLIPKWAFNFINSILFCILVLQICRIACPKSSLESLGLVPVVFSCLFIFTLSFGQVYLWLDGSVNYSWSVLFLQLYLSPYIKLFYNAEPKCLLCRDNLAGVFCRIMFVLFSLLVGAYGENSAIAAIMISFLLMGYRLVIEKGKISAWYFVSFAAACAGFLFMATRPAETSGKLGGFDFQSLFTGFKAATKVYLNFWILLIAYCFLFYIIFKKDKWSKALILSLVFFVASVATNYVMMFARWYAGRSALCSLIMLITANAILFPKYASGKKKAVTAVSAAITVLLIPFLIIGIKDITESYDAVIASYSEIEDAAKAGLSSAEVKIGQSKTKYSAITGLGYITTDSSDWRNLNLAEEYGIASVIGRE